MSTGHLISIQISSTYALLQDICVHASYAPEIETGLADVFYCE